MVSTTKIIALNQPNLNRESNLPKALLFMLTLISIVSFFIVESLNSNNIFVGLIFSLLFIIPTIFVKIDNALCICFFFMPIQSLLDNSGFSYTLNILFLLLLIRLIIKYKELDASYFIIVFLFVYNLFNIITLTNDLKNILSSFSMFSSIMLCFQLIKNRNKIDKSNLFSFFLVGCILSELLGIFKLINIYGFNSQMRFYGLTRDVNFYALMCLCGFSLTNMYTKVRSIPNYLCKITFIILGILTTSKMFLLMLVLNMLFLEIKNILNRTISIKTILLQLLLILVIFIILFTFSPTKNIILRYIYRFQGTDLTTGRIQILVEFFNQFKTSMRLMLFGAGTNYYDVYNVVYNSDHMYCHMTYAECLLSFGFFGSALFLIFIVKFLFSLNEHIPFFSNENLSILNALVCAVALPLFTADFFYVIIGILTLIGFSKRQNMMLAAKLIVINK